MKRIFLLAMATASCSPQAPWATSPDTADLRAAAASITAEDMHRRIAFLASDALRGRDTPSPELDSAAAWVARELDSFGLEPAGDDGWLQHYPYPAAGLDPDGTAFMVSAGATHSFRYGDEFYALRGVAVPRTVGVVFAGETVSAGQDGYADRAVLVRLPGLPEPGRRGLALDREARATVSRVRSDARAAGAAAVVFLMDERVTPGEVRALAEAAERVGRVRPGAAHDELPAFFLGREAADRLFRMAGLDPALAFRVAPADPVPLPGVTLSLAAPTRVVDDARAPNVAGVLQGSDPELRNTHVVISAHLDHVGVGRPDETGDSIYNGADDNASGTAALVEVAEAMARLERRPRRSVLFLAVSGEEKGLVGSRWFAENPTVPLESIVANLNLDMVSRNAPDSIVVIGQEYSSLGDAVRTVARRHRDEIGLTVADDLWPEQRFFFRSDQFNFAREEIPALFFFAGIHEDYHRPGDEVEEVDAGKAARVARLVFYLTEHLAESGQAPRWDPDGLETVRQYAR